MTISRHREDVERAYQLQTNAAIKGAAQSTALGIGFAVIAHHFWPLFRRQTLPFKGFLVSGFTIFGLVTSADRALLSHEADRRAAENAIRREARLDLARRGLVATETEIAKWKAAREHRLSTHDGQG